MTLFEAIESGDLTLLRNAIAHSTDVNVLGEGRTTPLIEAAKAGWLEAVQLLLQAGGEPSWKDGAEETALLKAAANGHAAVVSLLGPLTSDEDQDLARAFLAAFGASHAPDFHYDENRLKKKAVELAARAAHFVGNEDPLNRVNRVTRAESLSDRDSKKK